MSESKLHRIAVCIGGTNTSLALLDETFQIVDEESLPTPSGGDLMEAGKAAPDRLAFTAEHWEEFVPFRRDLLDALSREIARKAETVRASGGDLLGVGISAPGAVHPKTGEILGQLGALNLPAWGEFNLKDEVHHRTGLTVRTINDAKAMALGALTRMEQDAVKIAEDGSEKEIGKEGAGIRDFIELDPGTGLGGAYVVDREIWFGGDRENPDPDVGELWKLDITPDEPGSNLEEQASGRATFARVEKRLLESGEGRELLDSSGARIKTMLATASGALRTVIEEELKQTGRFLGKGIRLLRGEERTRLSAPDIRTFMIGGGLVSKRSEEAKSVRRLLHQGMVEEMGEEAGAITMLFTVLGGAAGIYGSAALLK